MTTPEPPPDDVRITFRVQPPWDHWGRRVARLLRFALRTCGLRNLKLEWVPRDASGHEGGGRG
jgi:hypothetical protein